MAETRLTPRERQVRRWTAYGRLLQLWQRVQARRSATLAWDRLERLLADRWRLEGWPPGWALAEDPDEDCHWVTLDNGVKVCISDAGEVQKGPEALRGRHIRDVRPPTAPKGPVQRPLPGIREWEPPQEIDRLRQDRLEGERIDGIRAIERLLEEGEEYPTTWDGLSLQAQTQIKQMWIQQKEKEIYDALVKNYDYEKELWKDERLIWEMLNDTLGELGVEADFSDESIETIRAGLEFENTVWLRGFKGPNRLETAKKVAEHFFTLFNEELADREAIGPPARLLDEARVAAEQAFGRLRPWDLDGLVNVNIVHKNPRSWPLLKPDGEKSSYRRVQALGRALVARRAERISAERGGSVPAAVFNRIGRDLWDKWKVSSVEDGSLALQLAVHEELGANTHLSPAQERAAREYAEKYPGGLPAVRAYVRALWETTQYLMSKARTPELTVYRAVMVSKDLLEGQRGVPVERQEPTSPGSTVTYSKILYKLPDLTLRQNALQSFTADLSVANSWQGIPEQMPERPERVVIVARVPATAVLSLPVYGDNLQEEQEVVVLGTPWREWTAWRSKAHANA